MRSPGLSRGPIIPWRLGPPGLQPSLNSWPPVSFSVRWPSQKLVGRISCPGDPEPGLLLYLKSGVTGDDNEVVAEYRNRSPSFPHESTAAPFFNAGQFEACRARLSFHTSFENPLAPNAPPREIIEDRCLVFFD